MHGDGKFMLEFGKLMGRASPSPTWAQLALVGFEQYFRRPKGSSWTNFLVWKLMGHPSAYECLKAQPLLILHIHNSGYIYIFLFTYDLGLVLNFRTLGSIILYLLIKQVRLGEVSARPNLTTSTDYWTPEEGRKQSYRRQRWGCTSKGRAIKPPTWVGHHLNRPIKQVAVKVKYICLGQACKKIGPGLPQYISRAETYIGLGTA